MNKGKKEEIKKAIALKYEPQHMKAPKVIAKGQGKLAEKIIEIAKKNKIHIHHDSDLTNMLYKLDLLDEIPPHLYSVIAEIFMFLYKLNKKTKMMERGAQDETS